MLMLMPMENCAMAVAGIERSIPAKRTELREQILKVFICSRLSRTVLLDFYRGHGLQIAILPQDCETSGAKLSGKYRESMIYFGQTMVRYRCPAKVHEFEILRDFFC
jgi:hypothetical protein